MNKLSSLQDRLAKIKSSAVANKTIIQMIDPKTKQIEAEDTLSSFYENNEDDDDVIEALDQLKSGKKTEVKAPTGQGVYILKVK